MSKPKPDHDELVAQLEPLFRDTPRRLKAWQEGTLPSKEAGRAVAAYDYLLEAFKTQGELTFIASKRMGSGAVRASGITEAMDFLDALMNGRPHPLLDYWLGLRTRRGLVGGRFQPPTGQAAIAAVSAAAEALREKVPKGERGDYYNRLAKLMTKQGGFSACTADTVDKWRRKQLREWEFAKHLSHMKFMTPEQIMAKVKEIVSTYRAPLPSTRPGAR